MNIYKFRYINALKKAAKINRMIKNGYRVFHDGAPVTGGKFILRDDEIIFKHDNTTATSIIVPIGVRDTGPRFLSGIHCSINRLKCINQVQKLFYDDKAM